MNKKEIVNAAFKVWGRNLYQKTSLSQLAAELGVSKPALYRHFKNKQALTTTMNECYLDDFASSIRPSYEQAIKTDNVDEGIFLLVNSIAGYFIRNVFAHIFSIMNFYEHNIDHQVLSDNLKNRGVNFSMFKLIFKKKYDVDYNVIQLIFSTVNLYIASSNKMRINCDNNLADKEIEKIIFEIDKKIKNGLCFPSEKIHSLDFINLEKKVNETFDVSNGGFGIEPEPLFKAVAEAVAEAGPWNTTMEMVAKRMGLSKSSLYGHFKNRKDMLYRLFMSEFKRIIEFAHNGVKLSQEPMEQLYLSIYSISMYLRRRPEILITMSWFRTRRLEMGKPEKKADMFRIFRDIDIEPLRNSGEKELICHWILFLLIRILIQPYQSTESFSGFSIKNVQSEDIRVLYKFITLGLGGFIR